MTQNLAFLVGGQSAFSSSWNMARRTWGVTARRPLASGCECSQPWSSLSSRGSGLGFLNPLSWWMVPMRPEQVNIGEGVAFNLSKRGWVWASALLSSITHLCMCG